MLSLPSLIIRSWSVCQIVNDNLSGSLAMRVAPSGSNAAVSSRDAKAPAGPSPDTKGSNPSPGAALDTSSSVSLRFGPLLYWVSLFADATACQIGGRKNKSTLEKLKKKLNEAVQLEAELRYFIKPDYSDIETLTIHDV